MGNEKSQTHSFQKQSMAKHILKTTEQKIHCLSFFALNV